MGNPKHKISKSRRDKRRTHKVLSVPSMSTCPQCREYKLPYHACPNCGTYKGLEILTIKEI